MPSHNANWGKNHFKVEHEFTKIFQFETILTGIHKIESVVKQNLVKMAGDSKIQMENSTKYLLWLLKR